MKKTSKEKRPSKAKIANVLHYADRCLDASELLIKNGLAEISYNILWLAMENLGSIQENRHQDIAGDRHLKNTEAALMILHGLRWTIDSETPPSEKTKKEIENFKLAFDKFWGHEIPYLDEIAKRRHPFIYINSGIPPWKRLKKGEVAELSILVRFLLRFTKGSLKTKAKFKKELAMLNT